MSQWICRVCSLKNVSEALQCVACGKERHFEETQHQWQCPHCTFVNEGGAARCLVCLASKQGVLPGWLCKACYFQNANGWNRCQMCGNPSDALQNAPPPEPFIWQVNSPAIPRVYRPNPVSPSKIQKQSTPMNLRSHRKAPIAEDTSESKSKSKHKKPYYHSKETSAKENKDPLSVSSINSIISKLPRNYPAAKVPGRMRLTLYPHQKSGLAFMKSCEEGPYKGGLLADSPGLGKTIQTVALMCARPPPPAPKTKKKLVLVVCPLSELQSWIDHLVNSTDPPLNAYAFYGAERRKDFENIHTYDCLVTTFHTLQREHHTQGPLYQKRFHRVVVDEAHLCSKNVWTAISALKPEFRWVLTATPVEKSVTDIVPIMEFLQINITMRGSAVSVMRLKKALNCMCICRSNDNTKIKPPDVTTEVVRVDFSNAEREYYDRFFKRAKKDITVEFRRHTLEANYTHVLALLLRLRQFCCHPGFLPKKMQETLRLNRNLPLLNRKTARRRNEKTQAFSMLSDAAKRRVQSSFDKDGEECPICMDVVIDELGIVTRCCGQTFCIECFQSFISSKHEPYCPYCRSMEVGYVLLMDVLNHLGYGAEEEDIPEKICEDTKVDVLFDQLEMSSKFRHVFKALKEVTTEKTVVFSQFTEVLSLIEVYMGTLGLKFLRFDGSLTPLKRTKVLSLFRSDAAVSVMLMSMKCASLEVNLTAAKNVMNPQVVNQAIERVCCLGQTSRVRVWHFIIRNSVEEAIFEIYKRKLNAPIKEKIAKKEEEQKLKVEDLLSMFDLNDV